MQDSLHATHLLKLLDDIYKYEMDPTRTVGAIERAWDGRTNGQTDGLRCVWGIINWLFCDFVHGQRNRI